MQVKHFQEIRFRTRDPLHPGQWVVDRRLEGSGTGTVVHAGQSYTADAHGWFDVPEPVGTFLLRRPGWRTPAMVDEDVAAGFLDENDSPVSAARMTPGRAKGSRKGS